MLKLSKTGTKVFYHVYVICYEVFIHTGVFNNNINNSSIGSNPTQVIQHYVIQFISNLWQVIGFLLVLLFSSTNKTDRHDITEILLKVGLNFINHHKLSIAKTNKQIDTIYFYISFKIKTLPTIC